MLRVPKRSLKEWDVLTAVNKLSEVAVSLPILDVLGNVVSFSSSVCIVPIHDSQ